MVQFLCGIKKELRFVIVVIEVLDGFHLNIIAEIYHFLYYSICISFILILVFYCGHSFCGSCCSKYAVLRRLGNYYQERVCDLCYVIVTRICTYYRDERKAIKLVESRHVKFDNVMSPVRRSDTPDMPNSNVKGSRRESAASEQSKFSFSDDPILF